MFDAFCGFWLFNEIIVCRFSHFNISTSCSILLIYSIYEMGKCNWYFHDLCSDSTSIHDLYIHHQHSLLNSFFSSSNMSSIQNTKLFSKHMWHQCMLSVTINLAPITAVSREWYPCHPFISIANWHRNAFIDIYSLVFIFALQITNINIDSHEQRWKDQERNSKISESSTWRSAENPFLSVSRQTWMKTNHLNWKETWRWDENRMQCLGCVRYIIENNPEIVDYRNRWSESRFALKRASRKHSEYFVCSMISHIWTHLNIAAGKAKRIWSVWLIMRRGK
jgi:hypothetical protein